MWPRSQRSGADSGAVLVLALIFILIAAVPMVVLAGLAEQNERATSQLHNSRALQYATDGAVNSAIQKVRFNGDAFTTPTACLSLPADALNAHAIWVSCQPVPGKTFVIGSRFVQFVACTTADLPCPAGNVQATVQAQFNDLDATNHASTGFGALVLSWVDVHGT